LVIELSVVVEFRAPTINMLDGMMVRKMINTNNATKDQHIYDGCEILSGVALGEKEDDDKELAIAVLPDSCEESRLEERLFSRLLEMVSKGGLTNVGMPGKTL